MDVVPETLDKLLGYLKMMRALINKLQHANLIPVAINQFNAEDLAAQKPVKEVPEQSGRLDEDQVGLEDLSMLLDLLQTLLGRVDGGIDTRSLQLFKDILKGLQKMSGHYTEMIRRPHTDEDLVALLEHFKAHALAFRGAYEQYRMHFPAATVDGIDEVDLLLASQLAHALDVPLRSIPAKDFAVEMLRKLKDATFVGVVRELRIQAARLETLVFSTEEQVHGTEVAKQRAARRQEGANNRRLAVDLAQLKLGRRNFCPWCETKGHDYLTCPKVICGHAGHKHWACNRLNNFAEDPNEPSFEVVNNSKSGNLVHALHDTDNAQLEEDSVSYGGGADRVDKGDHGGVI